MATLEKRVQVLFDPERYAALEAEARVRGISAGALIRMATDQLLDQQSEDARHGLRDMFANAAEDAKRNSYAPVDWVESKAAYERELDPLYRLAKDDEEVAG